MSTTIPNDHPIASSLRQVENALAGFVVDPARLALAVEHCKLEQLISIAASLRELVANQKDRDETNKELIALYQKQNEALSTIAEEVGCIANGVYKLVNLKEENDKIALNT